MVNLIYLISAKLDLTFADSLDGIGLTLLGISIVLTIIIYNVGTMYPEGYKSENNGCLLLIVGAFLICLIFVFNAVEFLTCLIVDIYYSTNFYNLKHYLPEHGFKLYDVILFAPGLLMIIGTAFSIIKRD
jgi:hypothetical protein